MASKNPSTEVSSLLGGSSSATSVGQVLTSATGSLGGNSAAADSLTAIGQQLQELQTINQTQIDTMKANTTAVSQNTVSKSGGSTASSVGTTLLDVLGIGSGLSPLISGIISLFAGGGSSQPAPPTPYIQPLPVHLNAGTSASSPCGPFGTDYGQGGQPRSMSSTAATQITVQVQAMDSKSFLDHSQDIAAAVRQAMLESSTLNDVIREV